MGSHSCAVPVSVATARNSGDVALREKPRRVSIRYRCWHCPLPRNLELGDQCDVTWRHGPLAVCPLAESARSGASLCPSHIVSLLALLENRALHRARAYRSTGTHARARGTRIHLAQRRTSSNTASMVWGSLRA